MKEIQLTKGFVTQVDDEDYPRLTAMGKWHALVFKNGAVYASKSLHPTPNRCVHLLMHRFLLDAPNDRLVDHKDGHTLIISDSVIAFKTIVIQKNIIGF